MNLHTAVARVVSAVNPLQQVTIQQATGYVTNADGSRTSTYASFPGQAQIQALSYTDLRAIEGLQIAGLRRAIFLWGNWNSMIRATMQGGDLITFPDGSVWLVVFPFEHWGHGVTGTLGWCKVCVTLQNEV